eukprot:Mrub_09166.p1 GENE.Mrub_09166~~Mrub_09166.p1  ORF type:complete len:247 (-),score=48.38 Mrub_09166:32-712(-)
MEEDSTNNQIIIKFESPDLYGYAYLNLEFRFTDEYPMRPPVVKFLEPIPYHPNVYTNGNICLDSLQNNWTPALKVNNVVLTIFCLLTDPNPSSPANIDAGKLMRSNFKEYKQKCIASMKGGDRTKEKNKELGITESEETSKIENPKGRRGKNKKVDAKSKPNKDDTTEEKIELFNSNNDDENNKLDLEALGMTAAEYQQQIAAMQSMQSKTDNAKTNRKGGKKVKK